MTANQKIITIKLSDRYAQIGWMVNLSTEVKATVPLYVGIGSTEVFFLDAKAFGEFDNPLILMQSEEKITEYLKTRKIYPKPVTQELMTFIDAQTLWATVMVQLVNIALRKIKGENYEPIGFVICFPDMIDASLRQLIINSVDNCKNYFNKDQNKPLLFKAVPNSFGCCARILFDEYRGMVTKVVDSVPEIYQPKLIGIIDYGFHSTELYIILTRDKSAVVVGKGKIDIGMNEVYQLIVKRIDFLDPNQEMKPFELWDRQQKNMLKEMKNAFVGFCEGNVTSNYFQNSKDDKIRVERHELEEILFDINTQIPCVNRL